MLFDLGDIASLSPRKIQRLGHVFVSHAHIDHFVGFDRLLWVLVGRDKLIHLYGPNGFIDHVHHKLRAYQPAMKARMAELEQQKAEIEARLAEAPADLPDIHPNIAEHYRAKVLRLAETLAEPESNGEAREARWLARW